MVSADVEPVEVSIRSSRGALGRLRSSATECKSRSHGFTEHLPVERSPAHRDSTSRTNSQTRWLCAAVGIGLAILRLFLTGAQVFPQCRRQVGAPPAYRG